MKRHRDFSSAPTWHWTNWLLLGGAIAIVVLASTAINSLSHRSDVARQIQVAVAQLEHKAQALSAMEWEALHKGKLSNQLAEKVAIARREMEEQLVSFNAWNLQSAQIDEVKKNYNIYRLHVDQEFQLLAEGKIADAEAWDDNNVDPAFEELSASLRKADMIFSNLASQAFVEVQWLTYLILSGSAMVAGLIFLQFQQRRQLTMIAETERRVLQQANDQLEARVQERTAELQALHAKIERHAEQTMAAKESAEAELVITQKQMILAARNAGMAEVATGILHNVGNVLNSVNVSVTVLGDKLNSSQITNLAKATNLLSEHTADLPGFLTQDPRGRRLPAYLIKISEHLATEQSVWRSELEDLTKNIKHIKEIVTMQQGYARLAGTSEILNPENLVQDALQMNEVTLERHGITLVRDFRDVVPVNVDKHKVLQILVNLVGNAKHALQTSDTIKKILTIRIFTNQPGQVSIQVADNGVGIAGENLTRIFQHGFTTKKDGHGFGLHSSANAAREMGGNLSAHSDGPGRGATFTLVLPVKKEPAIS